MVFYDFEVFKYDWLVVMIDPKETEPYVIINNVKQLKNIYEQYENDVWVGFNSRHYDQYILKGLLCGFDAWEINDWIINRGLPGWQFSSMLKKIFLINYDVMMLGSSLKQLEGFQGHNIHESGVDFTIDRKLTQEEISETVKYCINDVKECMNVFAEKIEDFTALLGLVKEFHFPTSYINKTKAQISAEILECEYVKRNDEWDLFALDCLRLHNAKYKTALHWFMKEENHDYSKTLEMEVAGVPHLFAWGGLHGAKEKYHFKCGRDDLIIHVDVASYYPSLMIFQNLLTRSARKPERFKEIYYKRLKLKAEGKKKEQAPLKIVLNGTYGICKDRNNKAYDPRNANLICVNGQLLLLDLIEKLEQNVPSFELIQSNTDGLIIKCKKHDFEKVDDTCYEWESRTKMNLEFDYIKEIYQKDVNNYVFIQFDGKVERKGAYVKELNSIDNDLPIVNEAIMKYILEKIPPRKTITECNELVKFQKICKLTSKFDFVEHNGKKYRNKCYRIFASKRETDGQVQKCKMVEEVITDCWGYAFKTGKGKLGYYKFANTSNHSFIENGDIVGASVPDYLDKEWYIQLAEKRLIDYGVEIL